MGEEARRYKQQLYDSEKYKRYKDSIDLRGTAGVGSVVNDPERETKETEDAEAGHPIYRNKEVGSQEHRNIDYKEANNKEMEKIEYSVQEDEIAGLLRSNEEPPSFLADFSVRSEGSRDIDRTEQGDNSQFLGSDISCCFSGIINIRMFPIGIFRLSRIVEFVKNGSDGLGVSTTVRPVTNRRGRRKKGVEDKRKEVPLVGQAGDPRYLHFLKKACGIGKSEALKYLREQQRRLNDRAKQNASDIPGRSSILYEKVNNGVLLRPSDIDGLPVFLEKVENINEIKGKEHVEGEFEYFVYKYGDDFKGLSEAVGMSLKETILEYYLHSPRVEKMEASLIDKIVEKEWAEEGDRMLFEANYRKYGKKLWKYQIPRTERDLGIYYKYYTRNGMLVDWTKHERGVFARAFVEFGKDWDRIEGMLGSKTLRDIKMYYQEYFKKLSAAGKEEEMVLGSDKDKAEYESRVLDMKDYSDGE